MVRVLSDHENSDVRSDQDHYVEKWSKIRSDRILEKWSDLIWSEIFRSLSDHFEKNYYGKNKKFLHFLGEKNSNNLTCI